MVNESRPSGVVDYRGGLEAFWRRLADKIAQAANRASVASSEMRIVAGG
jgi:hypothetical protein